MVPARRIRHVSGLRLSCVFLFVVILLLFFKFLSTVAGKGVGADGVTMRVEIALVGFSFCGILCRMGCWFWFSVCLCMNVDLYVRSMFSTIVGYRYRRL
ncbi:hypothetical protein BDV39DRAFT_168446 [Aspergillus sergii]|uniref:Transmembrane protein n=1 Tax=Aspergillus sergii TaxID=1034303 RepID=A0A5N6XEP6_9EURO|nr:hypothetical protein BDV39DRAFT_168446 [Aspergillus sergii]